jgi:predicted ATPase
MGDTLALLPVLLGLGRFHQSRGDLDVANDIAARVRAIAEATRDPAATLAASNALGILAFYGGEPRAALAHLERGLALYDPEQHSPTRSLAFRAGQDPGVSCAVYAAWAHHLLGRPDRAAAQMAEALALARSLGHPLSVVYACHFAAGLHLCRGESETVQALETEALAYSSEHGFRLFAMMGGIHRGWALCAAGRSADALAQIREGLSATRAIGIELRRPAFLAMLADVCQKSDHPEEGLKAVAEALTIAEQTGQHYWDAEIHRLRGALTLQADAGLPDASAQWPSPADDQSGRMEPRTPRPGPLAASEAEASFLEAIRIARQQEARSLELRAATSLARLWADTGKPRQARELLSDACRGFTEGLETADMRQAQAVLDALDRLP